jgi:hypothetical protein
LESFIITHLLFCCISQPGTAGGGGGGRRTEASRRFAARVSNSEPKCRQQESKTNENERHAEEYGGRYGSGASTIIKERAVRGRFLDVNL